MSSPGYTEMKETPVNDEVQPGTHYPQAPLYVATGGMQAGSGAGYQSQYGYPTAAMPSAPPTNVGPGPTTTVLRLEDDDGNDDDDGDNGATAGKDDKDEAPIFIEKYNDLEFKACFHEHKSTPTIPIIYKINGYIFKYTKLFVYNAFVIVFGVFFSLLWAFTLGLLSFVLVWIWTPAFRVIMFTTGRVLPAATEPLKAFFTPLVDVQARLFRQIRVRSWLNGELMAPLGAAVNKEASKSV